MTAAAGSVPVRLGTPVGRAVVAAATLGSGMTLLDGSVVNVALVRMGEDLDASLARLQWVSNGYLLSLASLILLGGALGDRYGRRRLFVIGTTWFAIASLGCGVAPTTEWLIAARVLQGVGGAMLTPGSLALIQGTFVADDRARAIGIWSGLAGVATAVGPFIGGLLIDHASWRWIFLINLPMAAVAAVAALAAVPETKDPAAAGHVDVAGAGSATVVLAGTTYALIEWGTTHAAIAAAVAFGALVALVLIERRSSEPLLDPRLFADRTFSAANAMTFLVYGALGGVMFFLVIQLQTVGVYSALAAGTATLPITLCMLLLAAPAGALSARIGPRVPMAAGPMTMAFGVLLLLAVDDEVTYVVDVLPGLTIFGLGLALMVAPLTATVLAAAPAERVGLASGINNAMARAGSLLAVAALPVLVGLTGHQYTDPVALDDAYRKAMLACSGLLAIGGMLSWATIRDDLLRPQET